MRSLFRAHALEYGGARRYGGVLLARPLGHTVLATLFASIAACIVIFFGTFSYSRKVQITGVLLPESGLVRVVSSQVGVVVERKIREGQKVRGGETLFILANERASVAQADVEQVISSLLSSRRDSLHAERAQLRQQAVDRVKAIRHRADDFAKDVVRVEGQLVMQQRRVSIAEEAHQRFVDLRGQGFVSSAQVQDKQAELLDQRQRLADLERAKGASARDLSNAQADLRDLRFQAQRDQETAARSIATLEQDLTENEARRRVIVRAPHDGVVAGINAELGQAVTAGQALTSLLPIDTQLIAELYAPSRAAGFVKPGMDVLVRYQAYPYQKFGQQHGRVVEVSSTALRSEELMLPGTALSSGASGEPLYRIRVAVDRQSVTAYGSQHALKTGMTLDASVLLERRYLYEWVLEPVYTVTGRL